MLRNNLGLTVTPEESSLNEICDESSIETCQELMNDLETKIKQLSVAYQDKEKAAKGILSQMNYNQ